MRVRAVSGALAALILAVGLSACSAGPEDTMADPPAAQSQQADGMTDDGMTDATTDGTTDDMSDAMMSGSFAGLNGKAVSGTATIEGDELRLTGFSSDEGPDLHVYLASGTDEAAVSAGERIDAVSFDAEEQTFSLEGLDVSGYTDVVIHCDKAKAVFGAAKLS